MECENSHSKD